MGVRALTSSSAGYDDPQIGKEVYELDARGSRPNAIFEYPYRIPVFSLLDDPEPCIKSDGSFNPEKYDYIFVNCEYKYDLTNPEECDKVMPYDGPNI